MKTRRFKVVIAKHEQPETFSKLQQINFGVETHSGFLHLLEVAAGLLILESMRIANHLHGHDSKPEVTHLPAATSSVPSSPQPEVATAAAVSVASRKEEPPPPPVRDKHNIITSSSNYGEMTDVPAEDLRELMGS